MDHVSLEFSGQLLDDQSIMWALVDANSATDAQALRNVRLSCFIIHDDAFLPVSNRRAVVKTFVITFLWLTIVFLQNCNSHILTLYLCYEHIINHTSHSNHPVGQSLHVAQTSPLRCSAPRTTRVVVGVGNFIPALRRASFAVR